MRPTSHRRGATRGRRRDERGLSLVELLVSVTILAIATTVALYVFDNARRSFKAGENVAEMQQAVRIAFDQMVKEIRMAGLNCNPDGNLARPDEPIEAAYATAIVVRGDFDADDPVDATVPELALAGGTFLSVSTGNDEIRAFVLAQQDGAGRVGPDTLSYQADVVEAVRDGDVEDVSIDRVALTHDAPPYTLYRIALDDGGAPQATVFMENVRSLRFRYFDRAGNEVAAVGGGDAPEDRRQRALIRRVEVELDMMTRDPDFGWRDPGDPDGATEHHRKFRLTGDITPRNLGMVGIKDYEIDTQAPSQPDAPQLDVGHCGGLFVSWPPNPPVDQVAFYRLRYGTDPFALDGQRLSGSMETYIGGLANGVQHFVAVQSRPMRCRRTSRSTRKGSPPRRT
jgi:prepilin-type N-terminal cleavage/methylation domain-containing protein